MKAIISSIRFFAGRERVDGLGEFAMTRLGSTVVLAGPNGSGKTRILNALANAIPKWRESQGRILGHLDSIRIQQDALKSDRHSGGATGSTILTEAQKSLAQEVEINFYRTPAFNSPQLLNILPTDRLEFNDPVLVPESRRREIGSKRNYNFGYVPSFDDALVRLDMAIKEYFAASHQRSHVPEENKTKLIDRFEKLRDDVDASVGAKLGYDENVSATLDGKLIHEETKKFSNGQKKLLDFVSCFDMNERKYDDVIVLVDEPELYVHPGALIGCFDRLFSMFPNAQVFVATHCVPLIAHLGHENVWWVSDNRASFAGRQTQKVLEGLLGGLSNVDKLRALTLEPARLAALHYAYESLFPPVVTGSSGGDPQVSQILDVIRRLRNENGRPVRLLDFGAGSGRFIASLMADLGGEISGLVDYVAYEPDGANNKACRLTIDQFYQDGEKRCYRAYDRLLRNYGPGYFDKILLCNVLHEISPLEWVKTFRDIDLSLNDGGIALIVEDSEIPHGELAHAEGFIITDGIALKMLFEMDNVPTSMPVLDHKYEDRLFAYTIPKSVLKNITPDTTRIAVKWCNEQSLLAISSHRAQGAQGYRDGLIHSLLCQQHVNTSIALRKL